MAGGIGSRFWPISTHKLPKQFHDILGTGNSLIQQTYNRFKNLIPAENILIATNIKYKKLVKKHLPTIASDQILLEPAMLNTAPCILYSAFKIYNKNPDGIMIVAPSDHYIENEQEFINNVKTSFEYCSKNDFLITLGIITVLFVVAQGFITRATSKTESHAYRVLKSYSDFEIRKYEPALFSYVVMQPADYKTASGNGFRTLAGYIFGGNEKNQQISMTSPVTMTMADSVTMKFKIPEGMELESMPQPNDPNVRFAAEPEKVMAAITLLPFYLFDGISQDNYRPASLFAMLALGILGSGVAYIWNFSIIAAAGSSIASSVTYLTPVVAIIVGWVFLGEALSWFEPVGALLVIIGAATSQGRFNRKAQI